MEQKIKNIVEALLFVSVKPLKVKEIIQILKNENYNEEQVEKCIKELNAEYQNIGKPFYIKKISGGYRYYIKEEFFPYLEEYISEKRKSKLSQKALETLAIIAYKQPVTKSEIEAIRGVNVDYVTKVLMERNLISVAGREQAPGNPLLYQTTEYFLEYFGLNNLEDLPKLKEIDEILEGDSQIKKEIGDVILQEIMPQKLGMEVAEQKVENPDKMDSEESEQTLE